MLAAIQAGITTVLLPARNRKDIEDVRQENARNHEFASSGSSRSMTRSKPPLTFREAASKGLARRRRTQPRRRRRGRAVRLTHLLYGN